MDQWIMITGGVLILILCFSIIICKEYDAFKIKRWNKILDEHVKANTSESNKIITQSEETATDAAGKCDLCGSKLKLGTKTTGEKKGLRYWVCSNYPKCRFQKGYAEQGEAINGKWHLENGIFSNRKA
jgi:hypothetical protein